MNKKKKLATKKQHKQLHSTVTTHFFIAFLILLILVHAEEKWTMKMVSINTFQATYFANALQRIAFLIYASADFYHHIQLAFLWVFIRQFFIVIYTPVLFAIWITLFSKLKWAPKHVSFRIFFVILQSQFFFFFQLRQRPIKAISNVFL